MAFAVAVSSARRSRTTASHVGSGDGFVSMGPAVCGRSVDTVTLLEELAALLAHRAGQLVRPVDAALLGLLELLVRELAPVVEACQGRQLSRPAGLVAGEMLLLCPRLRRTSDQVDQRSHDGHRAEHD